MRRAERYLLEKQEETKREIELTTDRLLSAVDVRDEVGAFVRRRPVIGLAAAVAVGFTAGSVAGRSGRAVSRLTTLALPFLTQAAARLGPQLGEFLMRIGRGRGS